MKISIIMPLYNEQGTVKEILNRVNRVNLGNISKEIIIVDDGSQDNPQKILDSIKNKNVKIFYHGKNRGKGAAIRTGISKASGDIIVIQDCDLEYDPSDFKKMIKLILEGKTKVVYGSRFLGDKNNFQILSSYYANKFLSWLTGFLYHAKITDMETCYKMAKKEVFKSLNLRSDRFDIEPEITSKILKKGNKILEVPISYTGRDFIEGKKINWADGIKAIFTLFYWRLNN